MSRRENGDESPKRNEAVKTRVLAGTGMDLIVLAQQFRYALARLPRAMGGLRPAGLTNACLLEPLSEEIAKARRRRVGWQAIANELARAGVHKLSGAPFTAADLRSYISRQSERPEQPWHPTASRQRT